MLTVPLREDVDMSAPLFNIDAGAIFEHFVKLILTGVKCAIVRLRDLSETCNSAH